MHLPGAVLFQDNITPLAYQFCELLFDAVTQWE
jgi:hypothetical protein